MNKNPKYSEAYKIVAVNPSTGRYYSCNPNYDWRSFNPFEEINCCEYILGEITVPLVNGKIPKLFVFKDLYYAQMGVCGYTRRHIYCMILRGVAENIEVAPDDLMEQCGSPPGTCICDSFISLSKLQK